jgi:hypothetical protein
MRSTGAASVGPSDEGLEVLARVLLVGEDQQRLAPGVTSAQPAPSTAAGAVHQSTRISSRPNTLHLHPTLSVDGHRVGQRLFR